MTHTMTALERAFQLAKSGRFSTVAEIVGALRRDRYDIRPIQGPTLRRQLMALMKKARADDMPPDGP